MLTLRSSILTAASIAMGAVLVAPVQAQTPGEQIDLSFWKLTLPIDANSDGKVDEIKVGELQN